MCVLKIVRVRTIYLLFAMNSTDICVYSYMAFYTLFSVSLLIFEHAADAFAPVRFRFSQFHNGSSIGDGGGGGDDDGDGGCES